MSAALLQAPISRFGDTAANAGVLALLEVRPPALSRPIFVRFEAYVLLCISRAVQGVEWLPLGVKTFCASAAAGAAAAAAPASAPAPGQG